MLKPEAKKGASVITNTENTFPFAEDATTEKNPIDESHYQDVQKDLKNKLRQNVIEVLSNIFDPEIPVNIYELGLIYKIEINALDKVYIQMTLTSPHCPVAETLPIDVENQTKKIEGVKDVSIDLTWDPPWNPDLMSEAAKLELGFI